MNCYNCGAKLGKEDDCPNCGADMRLYKKIIMASNAYYNEALAQCEVRDLSGAIQNLQTSLRFSKKNIEARNLLGLIYFEMGEAVAALTEWVISKNYQPKENAASRYLDEIQNNPSQLNAINQTIKKYNQALLYCKQDSRDLAVLQLKKVLSLNSKMVKAHQLLALLYIQDGKYEQAKKSLRQAGKIDTNNIVTLRYLKEANTKLREGASGKKTATDELVSYQSGNETIIQPRYRRDTSVVETIINIVIGLAIGVAITWFLLVPGVRRSLQNDAQEEVLDANGTISSKNQEISSLNIQVQELTRQIEEIQNSEASAATQINSYEQLLQAYVAYTGGDIDTAGTAIAGVDEAALSSTAKTTYDTILAQVNAEYVVSMYNEGSTAYSSQDFEKAIENFKKVIELDEGYDNGNALFYLAQSYRRSNDLNSAKTYYQRFVELYPGTSRASTAQQYIDSE